MKKAISGLFYLSFLASSTFMHPNHTMKIVGLSGCPFSITNNYRISINTTSEKIWSSRKWAEIRESVVSIFNYNTAY